MNPASSQDLPVAKGAFAPTMNSLTRYRYPTWFRDAKFGIWAHWGPQSVPMDGDWYARGMYEQGSGHNQYHLAHYGHPSEFGYKDVIPLWKAEKWDPARLMKLYKAAGAKYFVSMGSHHDNFFLWNSKLHRWNATQMGPHRDVVGTWQREAKKNGLRFGVSEHLGASFTWFQASHGSDKTGPKAGVPYDGADPQYADLYHEKAEPGDTGWYSTNPKWQKEWYSEIKELVDNYHPDLLYSDGAIPFGNEVGLSMVAHFYNQSAASHGGQVEAVYNCKQDSGGRWVQDLERGVMGKVNPYPWQTDTSIGDWFYNRHWQYRPISWVVDTLVDVVSKNGNLLLNVVQRPDGTLDPEVERMLGQLGAWTAIHKEAIYGSRPWSVYGEGDVTARGGSFNENMVYSSRDIRFTTQGRTLYAFSLDYPRDGKVLIRSLAATGDPTQNGIGSVKLLGYSGKVRWSQDRNGLLVTVPTTGPSPITACLKITGRNLKPVPLPKVVRKVSAGANGVLDLNATLAELHGDGLQVESKGGKPNVGYWFTADESVSWVVKVPAPGAYAVKASIATVNDGARFYVKTGGQSLTGTAPNTGAWDRFVDVDLGTLTFDRAGEFTVTMHPQDAATWKAINLRSVVLQPVEK
ncbi:alpha-L-fucosidase [Fimbriimonas ginsengisoli Gsoil 348]|uniref:alpha-L-fucosidase n=1 Tax=Fimbriimonas ginsengisoli Gsoil 348 TaxID=661478 RepID=A0A068NRM8_FIMGI|nr:alpha-L-fucosidase [Fimbriimonas ginsengisoli Gsoil 348]